MLEWYVKEIIMAFCFIIGFVLGVGAATGIYVLVREEFIE
jgi:LPS O-antigen subunit length determinant protein (WzzB/FepE family)|tara:strand:+ start:155 stop:274 length:120 start_codon:yes stop_codon:yes gene_type:complete